MTRPHVRITHGQADVLAELACDGASNTDIAARLGVSIDTVKSRLASLYAAYGVHDRASLAVAHLRRRVVLEVCGRRRTW